MALERIEKISTHAHQRLAQRNLSDADIQYVLTHGTRIHNGSAVFVHLGRKDIPEDDLRISRWRRLEGTVLVLDPQSGHHLTTAYRNRRNGIKEIKRKRKYRIRVALRMLIR